MRKKLHIFIDWCFNKSQYISGIAFILLTIIGISDLTKWKISVFGINDLEIGKIIYYVAVIIAIIFGYVSIQSKKEIEKLETDNNEKGNKIRDLEESISNIIKDTDDLFNSYLKLLINNLDFSHTERMSVYKVADKKFILLGRSSTNPKLTKKGRNNYPTDEGFIGKGWEEGTFFIDDLPDPNTKSGQTYYDKVNEINKIPRNIIEHINMKSRTYYVHRIDGFDGNPKAVLVFESINEKAFDREKIRQLIDEVQQPLTMFIEKNNKYKYSQNNELGL